MTKGALTYQDLLKLPFDEYHELTLQVAEWQRKQSSQANKYTNPNPDFD